MKTNRQPKETQNAKRKTQNGFPVLHSEFSILHSPKAFSILHSQQGMAVIVLMVLISIIFLYITVNARTLQHLSRELKIIERRQLQRLSPPNLKTNSVALINSSWTASPPSANP